MIGLQVDSRLFEKLLKVNLPALRYFQHFLFLTSSAFIIFIYSKHLEKIGLHYILFTAQWFLCLFLNNMSSEVSFNGETGTAYTRRH